MHVVIGVDGEPDVGDDAGAFDIEQGSSGSGIEGDEVGVAAGAVPTGGAAAFVVAQAGHGDEGVGRWWRSGGIRLGLFFCVAAEAVASRPRERRRRRGCRAFWGGWEAAAGSVAARLSEGFSMGMRALLR